jgi:putative outer membrane protein
MKKIFKEGFVFVMIFLSAGFIVSCNDTLDEVIYSELTNDNAFKTNDDAIAATNSMYQPLHSVSARSIFYLNDMTTDACYREAMECEVLNELKMSSYQHVGQSWDAYYRMISRANMVLDKVAQMDETLFDDDPEAAKALKARLLAEAHFMRGFAYYQLTDLFYTVPLIIDTDTPVEAAVPPATLDELELQIEKDLTEAKSVLPQKFSSNLDAGRPTFGAAAGMLCRLHMRMAGRKRLSGGDATADWQTALENANAILSLKGSVYKLLPHVADVFDAETNKGLYNDELIFTVHSSHDLPSGSSDIGMNFTPWEYDMGWNLFSVPLQLTWEYEVDDERYSELLVTNFRDVYDTDETVPQHFYRIPNSVEESGAVYEESPTKVVKELGASYTKKYKYLHTGTYNYSTENNMPLIRLADIILCKAEILNELNGPTQESIDLINEIRSRAFQSDMHNLKLADYPNKETLRSAICDERLLELNNEGVRRPDLIRMGLWKDRLDKYIAGVKLRSEWKEKNAKDPSTADFSSDWKVYPQDLTEDDIRRYFPAPKRELDLNPALADCRSFAK